MRTLRGLRALTRIELRQFKQHPYRSLLVVLLVAIPVAAVMGGSTVALVTEITLEERRIQAMGQASLRIDGIRSYEDLQNIRNHLPEGTRVEPVFVGIDEISADGIRSRAKLVATSPATLAPDGLAHGMIRIVEGRAPANSGEVAISPSLVENLGRGLGESVTLEFGPNRRITGVVVDPENLDQALVLRTAAASEYRGTTHLLVDDLAEISRVVETLRQAEFTAQLRSEISGRNDTSTLIFALGIIGFVEAALVIAAAFAVSIRRRQREIGLVGAAGATSGDIWRSLLASTSVTALVGGLLGVGLGGGFALAVHPFLDGWNRRLNGGFEFSYGYALTGLTLGLLTALLATAIPARNASRLPIRVALSGRRPPKEDSRRWLRSGLFLVVAGFLLTLLASIETTATATLGVIVGPVLGLIGFGLCSPWLLDVLAQRAGRLPLSWRLALRDAGRFRARNGPVVTAILAGMSMSMTMAVLVASLESAVNLFPTPLRDDQLLIDGPDAEAVSQRVADQLAAVARSPLTIAYAYGEPVRSRFLLEETEPSPGREVAVGDRRLLRAMNVDRAAEPFESGRLVALYPAPGEPTLEWTSWGSQQRLPHPPFTASPADQKVSGPGFLLNEEALETYGLESGPPLRSTLVPWLVRLPNAVTQEQLKQAQALASNHSGTSVGAARLSLRPMTRFYWVILGLCVFTGLVIVLIANALTAAESASDERVLLTVGATPSLVRRLLAARAGYLALLGCVLAVPSGLLPTLGLFSMANVPLSFVFPWGPILLTLFILPLVAYSSAWLMHDFFRSSPKGARLSLSFILVALVVGPGLTRADTDFTATSESPMIRWSDFEGRAFDGSPLPGELGRIEVPERNTKPHGANIDLAFVRYRTTNPQPGPPIFFLVGGPGGSGVEHAATVATHPQIRLLEHRDVIGIDQRGTGITRPNLVDTEFLADLPLDRAISRADAVDAFRRASLECLQYWRDKDVDPSAYTSVESAHDIEAVRQALNLEQVVIYGSSYGSHLGLAYLRDYSHHVSRALLFNVEGPNHTWKLPSTVDQGLDRLSQSVGSELKLRDHLPNFRNLVNQLFEQLSSQPQRVNYRDEDGVETDVVVGPYDLQVFISNHLSSAHSLSTLPADLDSMAKGDWTVLGKSAHESRRQGINAMTLVMDCASGASQDRLTTIKSQTADPSFLLGDSIAAPYYPEVCLSIGTPDLGDSYRGPLKVSAPVLFVSGSLDIRTPPENVEDLEAGFSNRAHVVVENAAHGSRELMSPEYRRLLQAFLRGEPVQSIRIKLPRIQYQPIDP